MSEQICCHWLPQQMTCCRAFFKEKFVLCPRFLYNVSLQWCHNGHHRVSNHQPHHWLLKCLFRHRSKKTSKLRITGLCARNSLVTGEFPIQMASNAENVSIWWCHHVTDGYNEYWCRQWFGATQIRNQTLTSWRSLTNCYIIRQQWINICLFFCGPNGNSLSD